MSDPTGGDGISDGGVGGSQATGGRTAAGGTKNQAGHPGVGGRPGVGGSQGVGGGVVWCGSSQCGWGQTSYTSTCADWYMQGFSVAITNGPLGAE